MSGEGVDIDLYADDIGEDFNTVRITFDFQTQKFLKLKFLLLP